MKIKVTTAKRFGFALFCALLLATLISVSRQKQGQKAETSETLWRAQQHTVDDKTEVKSTLIASNHTGPGAQLESVMSTERRSGFGRGSLFGTDVDGAVTLDASGNLVLDLELRRLFDYYLSRQGELPWSELWKEIETDIAARFPNQAQEILKNLRNYQHCQEVLAKQSHTLGSLDLAGRLKLLKTIRERELGQRMHHAFFSHEESFAHLSLERMALARHPALNAEERAQRELRLVAELSPEVASAWVEQQLQHTVALAATAQNPESLRENFGPGAVARMQALQRVQDEFSTRVRAYLQARSRVPSATETQLHALRAQYFSQNEATRIAALDAIEQTHVLLGD